MREKSSEAISSLVNLSLSYRDKLSDSREEDREAIIQDYLREAKPFIDNLTRKY